RGPKQPEPWAVRRRVCPYRGLGPPGGHLDSCKTCTRRCALFGAIAGDIIGSVHEGTGTKTKDFPLFAENCRFTDDTVLTVAVAAQLLHGGDYVALFLDYFHAYPHAGYGEGFMGWARNRRREPYYSWGNGSARRVSPIGFACRSLDEVLTRARQSAEV